MLVNLVDAESRVLAGVLPQQPVRMEKAQLRLITEDNFSHPDLRLLWQIVSSYYDEHLAIAPAWAAKAFMEKREVSEAKIVSIMGMYEILCKAEIPAHEFEAALNLLKDDEITRKTLSAVVTAREILQGEYYDDKGDKTLKGQEDARRFLSESLQSLEVTDSDYAPEGDIRDDLDRLWQEYVTKEENPETTAGIKYGIAEVDEVTGGIRPGELSLIAGMTGQGKSHMVISLAWNAMRTGKNVLMFTTETTRDEMMVRILARHSREPQFRRPGGLDSHHIMNGSLDAEDREVFKEVLRDFQENSTGNLIMVQMPANGYVDYVYSKANQYNRKVPIDLLIVDSINLLRSSRRYDSKREMLEDLLQGFKRFASSFDGGRGVAIASPWQMSRTAWQQAAEAGGVYTLASLADSSEAEKSPSTIITIFLDGDKVYLQVLKNRGGTEMSKVAYPYDYRNSYIGSSGDAPTANKPGGNSMAHTARDIASFM